MIISHMIIASHAMMRYDEIMINESNENQSIDEIECDDDCECESCIEYRAQCDARESIASHALNANEIASYLKCDAKSLRAFIRSNDAIKSRISHKYRDRYSFSLDDARFIIASFQNRKSMQSHAMRDRDAIASLIESH